MQIAQKITVNWQIYQGLPVFLCIFTIDSRQFDRPTMVDYAGILYLSIVRINKFRFADLCKLHKKSRKPTSPTHPHMLHILSPAASASADRNSRQRDHMQIFLSQVRLFSPYANFPNCNSPAGNLTKKIFYGIILKKTIFLPHVRFAQLTNIKNYCII